jgi:hypothetical protein
MPIFIIRVSFPFLYDISVITNSLTRVVLTGVSHYRTFRHNHAEQPYTFHTQQNVTFWSRVCHYRGFCREVLRC